MYAQKRHAGWHTSRRLVWLHNNLRFFLSKLCWLGVRKVLFLWDVYSHHGDRLLSTWLRMEIITHSGPVTLLVGSDGGERDRPSKVPLRYRSTRCFSWLPSIPVYICGTEWAKSKTQASCRPLQWLNTRMIEDDKSHVLTGSKDYRYPPNINILKPTQQGLYIRHTGDQNRWHKADAGDNREPTPAKYSWFMLCGISLLILPSAVSFPCSGNWIASIYRNAYILLRVLKAQPGPKTWVLRTWPGMIDREPLSSHAHPSVNDIESTSWTKKKKKKRESITSLLRSYATQIVSRD